MRGLFFDAKVLAASLLSLLSENLDRGRFPSSILGSSLGGSLLSYLHTTTTPTAFGVSVGLPLPLLPPCVLKGGTEEKGGTQEIKSFTEILEEERGREQKSPKPCGMEHKSCFCSFAGSRS